MTKLKKLSSLALTITIALFGMALTASTAQAANIVFTVNESVVPGADPALVTADGITAKYFEVVTLNGDGTFSGNIIVQFTDYTLGSPTVSSQLDPAIAGGETSNTNLYAMYALVSVDGTFTVEVADGVDGDALPGDGNTTYHFEPTASTADIYLDPNRDTVIGTGINSDDVQILTASSISQILSTGQVTVCTDVVACTGNIPGTNTPILGSVLTGSYALIYTDPTLVNLGPTYWPTLTSFSFLSASASGDVDPTSEGSLFPEGVRGDTSVHFNGLQATTVPEPTSLFLLGSGLMGVAGWRRRRTATK